MLGCCGSVNECHFTYEVFGEWKSREEDGEGIADDHVCHGGLKKVRWVLGQDGAGHG